MTRYTHVAVLALVGLTLLTLASAQQFVPQYYPFYTLNPVIQADINGDGVVDFISETNNPELIIELLSGPPGTFTSQSVTITGSNGAFPIASGDFNNDGKTDLVLSGRTLAGSSTPAIAYGTGTGNFYGYTPICASAKPGVEHAQTPNFNGDGKPNMAYDATTGNSGALVADFNGDGKPDIAWAEGFSSGNSGGAFQVELFLNNGNGFDCPIIIYSQPVPSGSNIGFEYTTPLDLVLGDFDADGHADLAVRTTYSDPNNPANPILTLTALFGNGKGSFSTVNISTTNETFQIAAADMNNDGSSDIVANFGIAVFYGHPNRMFHRRNLRTPVYSDREGPPMLADFNGDQVKDIVYPASSLGVNNNVGVSTLLQSSNGVFTPQAFEGIDTFMFGAGLVPFSQTFVGDYNGDGKPDVALISEAEANHPFSLDLLLNNRSVANGTCKVPPLPQGIDICSPTPNTTVSNPVKFSFAANSFYPVRKMEVWIDGKKVSESYEVFANEGFSDVTLTLASGLHSVALYAGAFDGSVQRSSFNITVQ